MFEAGDTFSKPSQRQYGQNAMTAYPCNFGGTRISENNPFPRPIIFDIYVRFRGVYTDWLIEILILVYEIINNLHITG